MMQVANNNYNVLGKVGPHYERPEYRPPSQTDLENDNQGAGHTRPDRRTLSTRNTEAAPRKAVSLPSGKVTLDKAQELTAATCGLIGQLPPYSTSQEPHFRLPSRLMPSFYV